MSRTFVNTLIFEQGLDSINPANTDLYNWALQIYNPNVKIVVEDCHTALGEKMDLGLEIMGKLQAAKETPIDFEYLVTLANSGVPSTGIRGLSTCIADGGVCRTCLLCSRPWLFKWAPVGGAAAPIETIFHFDFDRSNTGGSPYSLEDVVSMVGLSMYVPDSRLPDGIPSFPWKNGLQCTDPAQYPTDIPPPQEGTDFCIEFVCQLSPILY